jgi:hypothetical protein
VGLGVALALCEASGSGVVVVGGVSRSCDVGWVGGESEVVEDVVDEVEIADVRYFRELGTTSLRATWYS